MVENENMEDVQDHTRESVLELITKKDNIEKEIAVLKEILDSNLVGLNGPLVDVDGFPREDVDVYAVRHARHKIICLQNDHKAIMRYIELGLHHLHLTNRGQEEMEVSSINNSAIQSPIARIDLVMPNSPAHASGLEEGDLILQFGTVNDENFTSLDDIANVVKHSVGRKVTVTVLRSNSSVRLVLTPKTWSGRGVLGCNLVPVEAVDR